MKPNGIGMAAILLLYTSLFPIRQQSNHHSIYQQEHTEELHPEVGEPYALAMAEDFFKFDYVFLLLARHSSSKLGSALASFVGCPRVPPAS